MQGYAEHILNMAVQNGILQKHEQFFEALIFGKIHVEEEEGLPCKYCLFFSDRGWTGDIDIGKWPLYYEIIRAIVFTLLINELSNKQSILLLLDWA